MSITDAFEKIAAQENAVFNKVENKYHGENGSFIHTNTYTLECNYRDVRIGLKNEFGHQNIGTLFCQLEAQHNNFEFDIYTQRTLFQFFNRNKSALKFAEINPQLKSFIELSEAFNTLNSRAKQDRFEPKITGKNSNGKYQISSSYHLVFNNNELVISPLIRFFKALIDFFLDEGIGYRSSTTKRI